MDRGELEGRRETDREREETGKREERKRERDHGEWMGR